MDKELLRKDVDILITKCAMGAEIGYTTDAIMQLFDAYGTQVDEEAHLVGFKNGKSATLHHVRGKQITLHAGKQRQYKPVQAIPVSVVDALIAQLSTPKEKTQ